MAAVTIHSDFGAQQKKVCHCFHFSPSICHEVMGQDAMILVFWMLSFKPVFFHSLLSLSCIGEGNGNPLQCSCLENPRDRGAWWAAVYGVAQSRTWLKQQQQRHKLSETKWSTVLRKVKHRKLGRRAVWGASTSLGVLSHKPRTKNKGT